MKQASAGAETTLEASAGGYPRQTLSAPSLTSVDRALSAAEASIADARRALATYRAPLQGAEDGVPNLAPILMTIPQTCQLLAYRKTKVYELMKRGLLPYVIEAKTGHRRVEYRAVQQLVNRMRVKHASRKAS